MALLSPVAGMVIRYSYLWRSEHLRGQEEGVKDRPCAVVLVTSNDGDEKVVTVLPITHTPPSNPDLAVEIPHVTKRRLGLDDDRSWIVITEANRFVWVGCDVRFLRAGDPTSFSYGLLPRDLFKEVTRKLAAAITARSAFVVPRTE